MLTHLSMFHWFSYLLPFRSWSMKSTTLRLSHLVLLKVNLPFLPGTLWLFNIGKMLQVDINDMIIWFTPVKIVIVHSYVKKPGGFISVHLSCFTQQTPRAVSPSHSRLFFLDGLVNGSGLPPQSCDRKKPKMVQDGAPKIAKLVYKWLNNGLW